MFIQPEKRNASDVGRASWALALSMEDESIKVVVLKGAGGQAFVSGADISEFDQKRNSAEAKRRMRKSRASVSILASIR